MHDEWPQPVTICYYKCLKRIFKWTQILFVTLVLLSGCSDLQTHNAQRQQHQVQKAEGWLHHRCFT